MSFTGSVLRRGSSRCRRTRPPVGTPAPAATIRSFRRRIWFRPWPTCCGRGSGRPTGHGTCWNFRCYSRTNRTIPATQRRPRRPAPAPEFTTTVTSSPTAWPKADRRCWPRAPAAQRTTRPTTADRRAPTRSSTWTVTEAARPRPRR
uniref:(northern house mosquito) hypothetical protein n=1 Tax=Culex pipiens TaxID=7175 RepID=A0A8D8DQ40_CULPI